ncbi:hypothetical protein CJ030_MR4G021199 [Morella rubra]|uniref:Protein LITTLE ZIPPER 1 n=1 Tax=Morella rubra TaxID=262757 RepID=A0A6A1VVY2_9ROSI|nr:hypothetical protein CJ030_MR4G021199 [Morella rubra]
MCINNAGSVPTGLVHSSARKQRSERSKVQVHGLITRRRCDEKIEKDIELKNLKLYLENRSIIQENEKLRRKASLLHEENLTLMYELQKKFPNLDRVSSPLLLDKK